MRPDLPGSARSARVEGPLSIERFVQAMLRAAGAAGVERAHVVAHSLGTIVAFHLAAAAPQFVRSLALFGPLLAPADAIRPGIRARGEKARAEGEAGMQEIANALVQAATSSETKARRPIAVALVREFLMRQPPDGYARTCDALADAQPADTSKITCPTLLVTGDEDAIAPAAGRAADRRAHARLPARDPARVRALDPDRETRRMQRPVAAVLREPAADDVGDPRRQPWPTCSSPTCASSTVPAPSRSRARCWSRATAF